MLRVLLFTVMAGREVQDNCDLPDRIKVKPFLKKRPPEVFVLHENITLYPISLMLEIVMVSLTLTATGKPVAEKKLIRPSKS